MDIPDFVNELPPSSRIGLLTSYLREEKLASPVDMYRQRVAELLRYGTQSRLDDSEFLGRLLFIGVVSAAEAYFRATLSSCIEICPVAQGVSAEQNIHLGGLLWHGQTGFSRSAFEHSSFASRQELSAACKKFLGITLDKQIFESMLDEFEIVCHLRHGIAHGDGILPGRNAVLLNIPKYRRPVRIVVRYAQLQDTAAVVSTLVMTFNRYLFDIMCKRWAIDWRQREDWRPENEKETFSAIWRIFYSVEDKKTRKVRSKISEQNCYSAVKKAFNI